ncbi:MAG: UDP-N-acetylmuramoyl-L-alanyl-D-glutamate--2,6-diaminopimelate ligase [Cyanobacteria bacterium CYA]|nr:MAG: UDP-N-acetylmuramoyl-L-alanyl-D-glutamate--2,6-diaminopimelate ligase [Cyanobacteria bacterium CYA]
MMLDQLIQGLGIRVVRGDAGAARVSDLTEDSRTAMPGSLFVARRGLSSDGRRFVGEACVLGASAVLSDDPALPVPGSVALCACDDVALTTARLAERFYGNPATSLVLVGVTGTNGKSTIAHLVHRMLNRCGVRCGLIGTVQIDDGRELAPASMTTPPALELSRTLATMVEAGCRAAAMEVSSHALSQKRADALSFDVGVFTNLTRDHADYHPSAEHYLDSKRRLFGLIEPGGLGIVNADDPHADRFEAARLARCSLEGKGDWSVQVRSHTVDGLDLHITGPDAGARCSGQLFGSYNAMNMLEAWIAVREVLLRIDGQALLPRLEQAAVGLKGPPGRIERISRPGDDVSVFVDYAHSPDALQNVLGAVRAVAGGRRVCVVFGCGGDRDRGGHGRPRHCHQRQSAPRSARAHHHRDHRGHDVLGARTDRGSRRPACRHRASHHRGAAG